MQYLCRIGVGLTQHHSVDQRQGQLDHPSRRRQGQRKKICEETQASQTRRRESEPERTCVHKMRWSVKVTHNAAIGVHVELEMTKCLLGTGNGEEMTRARPKIDFGQDFDPLEIGP